VLFAGGLLSTLTSALEASVYTFGASSKGVTGHKSPSVSPAGARLYFTERLGLSQYHNLADADEATLQLLSDERATQAPLFADHEEGKARALLIVEGVDDAEHCKVSLASCFERISDRSQPYLEPASRCSP
jgi:hypothetical protein